MACSIKAESFKPLLDQGWIRYSYFSSQGNVSFTKLMLFRKKLRIYVARTMKEINRIQHLFWIANDIFLFLHMADLLVYFGTWLFTLFLLGSLNIFYY